MRIPSLSPGVFGPRRAKRRVAGTAFDTTLAYIHQTTGNDTTGQLGNSAKPYLTMAAAAADLIAASPNVATTIVLQAHFYDAQTLPKEIYNVTAGASLTIDGAGTFTLASLTLEPPTSGNTCQITLDDISITSMTVSAGVDSPTRANFGTIYHNGSVGITQATFSEPGTPIGATGSNGTPGDDLNGTSGEPGVGSNGFPGSSVTSSNAGVGGTGGNGKAAWSVSLLEGPSFAGASYQTLTQDGCAGGPGGPGGGNSYANGGAGGTGSDALDDGMGTPINGYDGGTGGDGTAIAANGGNGGNGGEGGDLTKSSAIVIFTHSQNGGMQGVGGAGGTANAAGGSGGGGGAGVNGGSSGNPGSAGNTYTTNGAAGSDGSAGGNGSTTTV